MSTGTYAKVIGSHKPMPSGSREWSRADGLRQRGESPRGRGGPTPQRSHGRKQPTMVGPAITPTVTNAGVSQSRYVQCTGSSGAKIDTASAGGRTGREYAE